MDKKNLSCQSCVYCVEIEVKTYVCRRFPPQLFQFKGEFHSLYPPINNVTEWWCGEHKMRYMSGLN